MRWWGNFGCWLVKHEAPTWALAACVYGGWLALTLYWNHLYFLVTFICGGWLCAWHMSLQHEVIHRHPTRSQKINDVIGALPLNLWLPYPVYRLSHLLHHRDIHLTDPLEDPESTYASPCDWARSGPFRRAAHVLTNTVAGRMLVGPALSVSRFWISEARLVIQGKRPAIVWLGHAVWVTLILALLRDKQDENSASNRMRTGGECVGGGRSP